MRVTKKDIRYFFLLWLQLIVFVVFFMYPIMEKGDFSQQTFRYFLIRYLLIGCVVNFPLFVISHQFLTPRYFRPGKYLHFILFTLLLVLLYFPVKLYFARLFPNIQLDYLAHEGDTEFDVLKKYFFASSIMSVFVILLALGWRRIYDWFVSEKITRELENKTLNAEIDLLKMQINPHFLFNTLNNIYALSLDNSKEAPPAILKLSHLMRYILEETGNTEKTICLQREIDFIHDYVDLYRLRTDEKFFPNFICEGDFSNKVIAPLLLIPFVENAFKHGATKDEYNLIEIKISLENNTLKLFVRNKKRKTDRGVSHRTGLANTKKRLQLLYPNKHQLTIHEDEAYYETRLSVILL